MIIYRVHAVSVLGIQEDFFEYCYKIFGVLFRSHLYPNEGPTKGA